jgi:hypothetical protein
MKSHDMSFQSKIIFQPLGTCYTLFLLTVRVQALQVPVRVPLDRELLVAEQALPAVTVVPGKEFVQVGCS